MNRFDYDFQEYQISFNKVARKILKESYGIQGETAQDVSDKLDEAQVTYQKIQKILNCPEMIKSHAYLYALDMENVDECDKSKIDKLYDLGVARGIIQDEPENGPENEDSDECDQEGDELCGGPDDALTGQEMVPGQMKPSMMSRAFTVLYSAMKDGQVKTGEFFSSATDQDAAKSDCISSLSPLGYANIRILGIEQANDAVDMGDSDLDTLDEDSKTDAEDEAQETGDASSQEENAEEETKTSNGENVENSGTDDSQEQSSDTENQTSDSGGNNQDSAQQDSETEASQDDNSTENGDENSEKSDETSSSEGETEKKLTPTEKGVLKDEFVGMFKAELQATKLEKSPNDMNIKEKADFWNKILEKWKKQDPEEFMSPKEIEKLNNTVIKNS